MIFTPWAIAPFCPHISTWMADARPFPLTSDLQNQQRGPFWDQQVFACHDCLLCCLLSWSLILNLCQSKRAGSSCQRCWRGHGVGISLLSDLFDRHVPWRAGGHKVSSHVCRHMTINLTWWDMQVTFWWEKYNITVEMLDRSTFTWSARVPGWVYVN